MCHKMWGRFLFSMHARNVQKKKVKKKTGDHDGRALHVV